MRLILNSILTAIVALASIGALSAENNAKHSHDSMAVPQPAAPKIANTTSSPDLDTQASLASDCTGDIQIKVSGLVCDFCARALEKVFARHAQVDSIQVNLTAGLVIVKTKDGKSIAQELLRSLILDAGYTVNEIVAGCK